MLLRKKSTYNNINQRYFNHRNRVQDFCYLLIIFLVAGGGCPPAANFTLVKDRISS